MMPGTYDHLDLTDPLRIQLPMRDLVERVRALNYGEHRFLSELLRQRRASADDGNEQHRRHTDLLEELLHQGFF